MSYVERSWDGKQVVSTVKTVTDYIELKGSDMTDYSSYELQSDKWYVVKSNFERCLINAPSGKPANLIICNGAGIGGGIDANGATVTIYGGKVRATGGVDAAGIGSGEEQDVAPNIHGGSLTVYGGEVFADGTDWGAGIGGGEDADGAKVAIYGGTVTAWAGQDAGKKNGSAIGSEDGDGHRGSLKLGDNMKVWAGQNPSDADKHLFPFETRVPACFFRPYTRIVASR